jgi:hypothetical protein
MKIVPFILKIVLIAVLSYVLTLFLPWWTFVFPSLLVGFFLQKQSGFNFLSGFLGVALYVVVSCFWIGSKDDFVFAGKVAEIFAGNMGVSLSAYTLIGVAALLLGLIGGLASYGAALIALNEGPDKIQDSRKSKQQRYTLDLK